MIICLKVKSIATRAIIAFFALTAPIDGIAAQENWMPSIVNQNLPSIYRITVRGKDREGERRAVSVGTAFLVHNANLFDRSYLVTAAHVIGNPRTDWLIEDGKPDRTIAVQRYLGSGRFEDTEKNAIVVSEDHNSDVAVIEITAQRANPIAIRSLNDLTVGESLVLLGLPEGADAVAPVSGIVRKVQTQPFLSFDVNLVATPGQSGGPIVDRNGRAAGIASQNNNKTSAQWHTAAPAILALSALNDHLRKRGWPEAQFQDTECTMYGSTAGVETPFHTSPTVTVNVSFLDAVAGCRITRVEHDVEKDYNFSNLTINIEDGGKRAKVMFNLFDRPRAGFVKLHYRVFQERWQN
jgi:S1-C subfamily serine protease